MNLKSRILLTVIKIAQHILYWRVKSSLPSNTLENLNLNPDKPVFYVTRYRSFTDALVLHKECMIVGIPDPFAPFKHTFTKTNSKGKELNYWNQIIPLTRPGITEVSTKSPRYFSNKLHELVTRTLEDPNFDVQLVPASVFWGRSPRIEGSFWSAAFSDSWSIPGFFRKFIMVITKGRKTYVQLSTPFSLRQILERQILEGEHDTQRGLAKTHRLIRRRMKMQRTAFIGPDLSHRRTLLLSILDTPKVKHLIARQAHQEKRSLDAMRKKALGYANEIAADYSHSVIRAMHVLLKWLWTRLYNGVQVHGGPELQQLAHENAIVYVPCHRSHMDYLLLSFVLYDRLNLVPPHIAAGVNLNLPMLGSILRRAGAFFMRRSFKDNPLYAAVFSEYLHRVLDRGFSIEYFIEGGRSRTGRQLHPKPGMLSMTLESYASTNQRSLVFVPVNFCYERLFEGKSYLGELRGNKKPKETLIQFIKSLKRIKHNFGQVHVTFGEPISAKAFLENEGLTQKSFRHLGYPVQKKAALNLGQLISTRINGCATAHGIALLSIVIKATTRQAIEEELLITQLTLLIQYLKANPYSNSSTTTSMSPQEIIEYAENLGYIFRYPNQFGDIIFATEKQTQYLSYFRNNILHFFVVPSLLSLLYCNRQNLSNQELIAQAEELYPFLQKELFLKWSPEKVKTILELNFQYLEKEQLLFLPINKRNLELTSGIIRPSLERFAIVLTLLEKSGSNVISPKELESQARIHAERISRLYQTNSPEYFDSKLFNNLVAQLFTNDLVHLNDEGKLVFNQKLSNAARQTEIILGTHLNHTLWTLNP